MPFTAPLYQLTNVYQHYGAVAALRDVSITFPEGRIIGIIGQSGAGKSTLLRCLNGLETPEQGSVFFLGKDLSKLSATDRRNALKQMGVIFQTFNLLTHKTVFHNVALPLLLQRKKTSEIQERVQRILQRVGLSDKTDQFPNQLSGGQRQRVAIARALVANTKVLICDEFTSALDPQTTQEILLLLKTLQQDLKLSLVFVSHDMGVVKALADEIYVMDQGSIVESGSITQIFSNPQHQVTKSLLSDVFHDQLPDVLLNQLKETPDADHALVLKLVFNQGSATQPLMAMLATRWQVFPNIIAGSLSYLSTHAYGHLIISLDITSQQQKEILDFFNTSGVQTELLGYLKWT